MAMTHSVTMSRARQWKRRAITSSDNTLMLETARSQKHSVRWDQTC